MAPYARRLGLIAVQVRAHENLPWATVDRTDSNREAAGRSQGLASHHMHVRVVDRQGNVRIQYQAGERVDPAGVAEAREAEALEPPRFNDYAASERRRLDAMRPKRENRIRTVVVNGVEFDSIWDGRGPIPGTRLPGEW